MKKKMIVGLALAILLALLSATAVAAGLKYTAQFSATQRAKEALKEKYGLTDEMLQMLYPESLEENGDTRVTFRTAVLDERYEQYHRIGAYTVDVHKNGTVDAAWSHDGREADWEGKSLEEAAVWAAPQLQMYLDNYHARLETWFDGPLPTPGFEVDTESMPAVTPIPGKITMEQATQLAQEAMIAEYEIAAEEYFRLHADYSPETDLWRIQFYGVTCIGYAEIDAATGEIVYLQLDSGAFSVG